MSPYTSTATVPAGVTVTPAVPGPPIRQINTSNLQIRKMTNTGGSTSSGVVTSDSVQTSPDSTSHEDTADTGTSDMGPAAGQPDSDLTPDSSVPGVKRTAEVNGCDTDGVKRIKSDSES